MDENDCLIKIKTLLFSNIICHGGDGTFSLVQLFIVEVRGSSLTLKI